MAVTIDGHGTNHVGTTIQLRERNGYDDSDFLALVEVAHADGTFTYEWIEYATTRAWTYNNSATVDARPDVIARYQAYKKNLAAQARARSEDVNAHMPASGRYALVLRGRKYRGREGVITYVGPNRYHRDYYNRDITSLRHSHGLYSIDADCRTKSLRVGIACAATGEVFYTTADNIDVVAPLDATD